MNTRIASYSAENLVKKFGAKRISGKLLKEAYKTNVAFDLEITDFSSKDCGRYVSPQELKKEGFDHVFIRFNSDRDLVNLKL